MNRNLLLCLLLLFPAAIYAQLTARPAGPGQEVGFYEFLPDGYNPSGTYKYPLIIAMHGTGERGNGVSPQLESVLQWGLGEMVSRQHATLKFNFGGQQQAFVVLFPQLSEEFNDWMPQQVDSMINYAVANLNIDVNKIFLTGYSLGGGGAWMYPSFSLVNAQKIAGIIPVSPSPGYADYDLCNIANGKVAVWAHHGIDDDAIDVQFTIDAINGIKACSPVIPPLAHIYPDGMHNLIWLRALDTLNRYQYPNMWEWMAGITRLSTPENNQDPVANAGSDINVVPSTATLNGSASRDPNDVIVNYAWTQTAGPSGAAIEKPNYPMTNLSGLQLGTYTFRLTVTDEFGIVTSDDVQLLVSSALPVGLSYFKGKNNGKVNNLTWSTSSEENADHFEILRSSDGYTFTAIGKLVAGSRTYSFVDEKAPAGLSYYRLKNVDKDGAFSYSYIIALKNNNPAIVLSSYPNPVKDKITLVLQAELSGKFDLLIHDVQGRLVRKVIITKPDYLWKGDLNLGSLQKGAYSIQIQKAGSLKEAVSFIKE